MAYTICYWDETEQCQKERPATAEETAELDALKAAKPDEAKYVQAVTDYLNAGAAKKNYDSIITAAIRAGYAGPFHDEGVAYATWMDTCWQQCYNTLAQVKSGAIIQPDVPSFVATLPPSPY